MCVLVGVSVGVSKSVSTSSRMGIVAPTRLSTYLFVIYLVIGDATSLMIIGSTTLPDRRSNSLHGI